MVLVILFSVTASTIFPSYPSVTKASHHEIDIQCHCLRQASLVTELSPEINVQFMLRRLRNGTQIEQGKIRIKTNHPVYTSSACEVHKFSSPVLPTNSSLGFTCSPSTPLGQPRVLPTQRDCLEQPLWHATLKI